MDGRSEKAPDTPEQVSVTVKAGEVVAINGKAQSPYECLATLNTLGVKHGIGRIDIVENRLVGMKSRGCYETPGGTIMMAALRGVEQLVLDRDAFKWRQQLGLEMSYVVYDGRWFTPIRASLQAAADSLATEVNGEVVLELYKGHVNAIQKNLTTASTRKSSPPLVKMKSMITAMQKGLSAYTLCHHVFGH